MMETMETLALLTLLIYVAAIIAAFAVAVAIWRGMKAHEKLAVAKTLAFFTGK